MSDYVRNIQFKVEILISFTIHDNEEGSEKNTLSFRQVLNQICAKQRIEKLPISHELGPSFLTSL